MVADGQLTNPPYDTNWNADGLTQYAPFELQTSGVTNPTYSDQPHTDVYEGSAGQNKQISMMGYSNSWKNSAGAFLNFDSPNLATRIYNRGMVPVVGWLMWRSGGADAAQYEMGSMLASLQAGPGNAFYDYVEGFAQDIATWGAARPGSRILIRLNHEHNGTWFQWSVGVNGNTAAEWSAVWQEIHGIFVAEGAHHSVGGPAEFWWCPNYILNTDEGNVAWTKMRDSYPGNAYVDVVGNDTYWGWDHQLGNGQNGFASRLAISWNATYGTASSTCIGVPATKPFYFGELAVAEDITRDPAFESKAEWITEMFASIVNDSLFQKLEGMLWWHVMNEDTPNGTSGDEGTWAWISSTEARDAWRAGIAHPYFAESR